MAINFGLVDQGRPIDFLRDMGEASQFQHNQRQIQRAEAVRQAMAQAVDPATGKVDAQAMRRAYVLGGDMDGLAQYERNTASGLHAQQKIARENMEGLSRMVSGVTDDAGYQRARIVAHRMGIDTSFMPQNYSPEVVQEAQMMLRGLAEQGELTAVQKDMVAAGIDPNSPQGREIASRYIHNKTSQQFNVEPGAGRYEIGPDGEVRTVIAPNNGGAAMGSPVAAPPPPPGFSLDGGPTPPASGNFLGG